MLSSSRCSSPVGKDVVVAGRAAPRPPSILGRAPHTRRLFRHSPLPLRAPWPPLLNLFLPHPNPLINFTSATRSYKTIFLCGVAAPWEVIAWASNNVHLASVIHLNRAVYGASVLNTIATRVVPIIPTRIFVSSKRDIWRALLLLLFLAQAAACGWHGLACWLSEEDGLCHHASWLVDRNLASHSWARRFVASFYW